MTSELGLRARRGDVDKGSGVRRQASAAEVVGSAPRGRSDPSGCSHPIDADRRDRNSVNTSLRPRPRMSMSANGSTSNRAPAAWRRDAACTHGSPPSAQLQSHDTSPLSGSRQSASSKGSSPARRAADSDALSVTRSSNASHSLSGSGATPMTATCGVVPSTGERNRPGSTSIAPTESIFMGVPPRANRVASTAPDSDSTSTHSSFQLMA